MVRNPYIEIKLCHAIKTYKLPYKWCSIVKDLIHISGYKGTSYSKFFLCLVRGLLNEVKPL